MTENNTSLVNVQTGEILSTVVTEDIDRSQIIPGQALASIFNPMRKGNALPVHMIMLESQEFDDDLKEELMDAYMGLKPRPFDDVVNQELPVIGAIIYQHPGYNGKDGFFHPEGYYQVRFLVELDGKLQLIISSSTSLAMNVSYILKNPKKGWWKFPEPVMYRFSKDQNRVHHIQNMYFSNHSRLLKKGK